MSQSNNSNEFFNDNSTYIVSKGTDGHKGGELVLSLAMLLLLKAKIRKYSEEIKEFKLAIHMNIKGISQKKINNFNNVILKFYEEEKIPKYIFMKTAHNDGKKNYFEVFPQDKQNECKQTDIFILLQYYKGYLNIKNEFDEKKENLNEFFSSNFLKTDINFILFTCANELEVDTNELTLTKHLIYENDFLYTEEGKYFYKICITENFNSDKVKEIYDEFDLDGFKDFLSKFKIYLHQSTYSIIQDVVKNKAMYFNQGNNVDALLIHAREKILQLITNEKQQKKDYLTELCDCFKFTGLTMNVFNPVDFFTGRNLELEQLHKYYFNNKEDCLSKIVAVCGIGGIGKTQLARKFVSKYSEYFDKNIIWIDSDKRENIEEGLMRLATDRLGIATKNVNFSNIATVVSKKLKYWKCLFVLDNVDDYNILDIFNPLMELENIHFLITSRQKLENGKTILKLKTFSEYDAISFCKKRLREVSENDIKKLVKQLRYFPLAIEQAISCINLDFDSNSHPKHNKNEISSYIDQLTIESEKLFDSNMFEGVNNDYSLTVYYTWKITFDKINNREENRLAVLIYQILAFMTPEDIQPDLFSFLNKEQNSPPIDSQEIEKAFQTLSKYSLVDEHLPTYNIHRLVQEITRIVLKNEKCEEDILKTALKLFYKTNKENVNQAMSVWSYAKENNSLAESFCKTPLKIIDALISGERYKYIKSFGDESLQIFNGLNIDPCVFFEIENKIAYALYDQDKNDEALTAFRNLMKKYHEENLEVRYMIGSSLSKCCKYEEALKEFDSILMKTTTDSPIGIKTSRKKIYVLEKQRKYELCNQEKNKIFQKNITSSQKIDIKMREALLFCERGNYKVALEYLEKIISDEDLNQNKKCILYVHNNIGVLYSLLGQYDKAMDRLKYVLNEREREQFENCAILVTKRDIASIHIKKENYKEALNNCIDIQKQLQDMVDDDNDDIFIVKNYIGIIKMKQKEFEEAEKIFNDNLKFQLLKVTNNNTTPINIELCPEILETHFNISLLQYERGNYEEPLLAKVNQILQQQINIFCVQNNYEILLTRSLYARILEKMKKYSEAISKYEFILEKQKEILGETHPDTIHTEEALNTISIFNVNQ